MPEGSLSFIGGLYLGLANSSSPQNIWYPGDMVAGDSLIAMSCFIAGADLVGIDGDDV